MNTFERCRFLGNGGTGSGSTGTIYRDCVIAGNLRDPDHVRLGHYGAVAAGGVWVDNRIVQEASFERCVITNNFGTGVWSDRASFYAQDCLIADNDGAGIGGARAFFSEAFMRPDAVAVTNCTILRNGRSFTNTS